MAPGGGTNWVVALGDGTKVSIGFVLALGGVLALGLAVLVASLAQGSQLRW